MKDLKNIHKNPLFYYILVPAVLAIWPLLVWTVYIPSIDSQTAEVKEQIKKAEPIMLEILRLDPERASGAHDPNSAKEFDYFVVVTKISQEVGIPKSGYAISSKPPREVAGQQTQNATVELKEVDILRLADFLSKIQLRWAGLQCESLTITRKEGPKDSWKAQTDFKYYH